MRELSQEIVRRAVRHTFDRERLNYIADCIYEQAKGMDYGDAIGSVFHDDILDMAQENIVDSIREQITDADVSGSILTGAIVLRTKTVVTEPETGAITQLARKGTQLEASPDGLWRLLQEGNNPVGEIFNPMDDTGYVNIAVYSIALYEREEDGLKIKDKTLCFDLDGVLAQYAGWDGDYAPIGDPMPGMRELLLQLRANGNTIIIFTLRGAHGVKVWADKHDMPYDWININGDFYGQNTGKPFADIYIDDRAVRFTGDVAQLATDIDTFKVWWEEE